MLLEAAERGIPLIGSFDSPTTNRYLLCPLPQDLRLNKLRLEEPGTSGQAN